MLNNQKQKRVYWTINGLIFGAASGFLVLLADRPAFGDIENLIDGLKLISTLSLLLGVIGGIFCGFSGIDQSINRFESFSFSHENTKYFFRFFHIAIVTGLFVGLLMGISAWLRFEIYSWLLYGPIIGIFYIVLYFVLTDGLDSFRADIPGRVKPNQGIWKTARNIIPITLTFYPFAFLMAGSSDFLTTIYESSELSSFHWPLSFNWLQALVGGIPLAFLFGGMKSGWLTCLQHLILRIMLHRTNAIPWNYARFLNHCTERLLLQRVGGRYRFIHRLVQERFAATAGHRLPPP